MPPESTVPANVTTGPREAEASTESISASLTVFISNSLGTRAVIAPEVDVVDMGSVTAREAEHITGVGVRTSEVEGAAGSRGARKYAKAGWAGSAMLPGMGSAFGRRERSRIFSELLEGPFLPLCRGGQSMSSAGRMRVSRPIRTARRSRSHLLVLRPSLRDGAGRGNAEVRSWQRIAPQEPQDRREGDSHWHL